jgi:hypothetical protein
VLWKPLPQAIELPVRTNHVPRPGLIHWLSVGWVELGQNLWVSMALWWFLCVFMSVLSSKYGQHMADIWLTFTVNI